MTVHLLHLVVYLEDGRDFKVDADQRDMRRAFMVLGVQDPDKDVLGFPRAAAWAALVRTGELIGMDWKTFNEEAVEVSPPDDDDVVTVVDPTGPAPAG